MLDGRGLWRGKREDNGEWVKGYYSDNQMGECWIRVWDTDTKSKTFGELIAYQVDPETLGEYTGLKDKSGVKSIFEGDIIRYTAKERSSIYIVGWNAEAACFVVYGLGFYSLGLGDKFPIGDFTFFDPQKCEILGNVYDNPELLEGAEK